MNAFRQTILAVGLTGLTTLCAAQASGQGAQSPASAHAFFQAVTQSQPVSVLQGGNPNSVPVPVTYVESAGCLSKAVSKDGERVLLEYTINWQAVRSVRVEGEQGLRVRGRGVDYLLAMDSREIAERLARALTVVRRHCDPVEGYGF